MKDKEKKGTPAEMLTEADKAEAILKKYDIESDKMEYTGFMAKFVMALAISFSIFQLYTATFGVLDAQLQRAVHLGFGLPWCICFTLPGKAGPATSCIPLISCWLYWERRHLPTLCITTSLWY